MTRRGPRERDARGGRPTGCRRARARWEAGAIALVLLAAARAGPAQAPAACAPAAGAEAAAAGGWPAPLDRVVTLRADRVPLRVALARLEAAARLRISYSPELLPLERAVCAAGVRTSAGDALAALLAGTGLVPVVAGADQVVLAPARWAAVASATPAVARSTGRLERVVVTGTATGGPERASPFAVAVLEGRDLPRDGVRSLALLLDATVPGLWLWAQSPTSPLARWGSVRGASSFGVSTPKIYLDGVEVANPLLLTQLDPARVERIEVIRGPQGAALYGADAISGVVQIVTRHEGVGADAPRAEVRGGAGATASAYADGGVLTQDHAVVARAGTEAGSAAAAVTVSTLGAFIPGATARQLLVHGSARRVGARAVVTGTARLQAARADAPLSPLLVGVPTLPARASEVRRTGGIATAALRDAVEDVPAPLDSVQRQRVRQYTLGTSATVRGSGRWTHVAVAGIDGYRLSGVPSEGMLVPSALDSALRAARGGADRATLRLSSTRRLGAPERAALSVTLGAEHSTAREATNGTGTRLVAPGQQPGRNGVPAFAQAAAPGTTWWSNSGVLAQGELALRRATYLTGGARAEYISGPAPGAQVALLPMLGAAWVRDDGPLTVKLRAAYGRGIRPARTVARGATWSGGRVEGTLTALEPESQAGVESGVDVLWGSAVALHATRFDQRASGLVQPVAVVAEPAGPGGGSAGGRRIAYELQNVGAIANSGWELQATSAAGPVAVAATLTLVSSRVDRLATGYRGDLRAGDRILEVPARTLGLRGSWGARRWTAAVDVARAEDWINYDRLALARALAASLGAAATTAGAHPPAVPVGARLRGYWRTYPGVTRVGVHASAALWRDAALTLAGENLLNRQLGEPDNVTVLPGRTVTLGVRTGF